MHKDGNDRSSGRYHQQFCCSFRQPADDSSCPCNHPRSHNGKKNRCCTQFLHIPGDYRLLIDRNCLAFRPGYALRTECRRYNARFKFAGQERLRMSSLAAARNLCSIAHITLLAVAAAAIWHSRPAVSSPLNASFNRSITAYASLSRSALAFLRPFVRLTLAISPFFPVALRLSCLQSPFCFVRRYKFLKSNEYVALQFQSFLVFI